MSSKTYSVYVEILANGDSEEQVNGVVEDILDDAFGIDNYEVYDVRPLDEDEFDDLTDVDEAIVEAGLEDELDRIEALRDEKLSDELG
jgi:hypothetical protein